MKRFPKPAHSARCCASYKSRDTKTRPIPEYVACDSLRCSLAAKITKWHSINWETFTGISSGKTCISSKTRSARESLYALEEGFTMMVLSLKYPHIPIEPNASGSGSLFRSPTKMVKPPLVAVAQVPNLNPENVKDSGFVIKTTSGLVDPGKPIITPDKTPKPPSIKQCKSDSECDTKLERCRDCRYSCGSGQSLQKHRTRICYTLCRGKTEGCSASELDESKQLMEKTTRQTLETGFSIPDSVSRKNFATEKCKIHLLNPVAPKNPAAISQNGVNPASQRKQKSKTISVQTRQLVTRFKS